MLRNRQCRCGGNMPGRCPGPQNCPLEGPRYTCQRCGEDFSNTRGAQQDFTDAWTCADCVEELAQAEGDE